MTTLPDTIYTRHNTLIQNIEREVLTILLSSRLTSLYDILEQTGPSLNLLDMIRNDLKRKNISSSLRSISDFEDLRTIAIDRVE